MNELNKIFKINNTIAQLLSDCVNDEGEIIDEQLFQYLESIQNEGIELAGRGILYLKAQAKALSEEIKRLKEIQEKIDKTENALEKFLRRYEGQKFEFNGLIISWRKSSAVEIDDFEVNINELEKEYPQLVVTKKELKKSEIKNLFKDKKTLPKGIKIVEKLNLQVK